MYYVIQQKKNKRYFKKFTKVKGLYLTTSSLEKAKRFNLDNLTDFQMYHLYGSFWNETLIFSP